jgi:hypothetical protein
MNDGELQRAGPSLDGDDNFASAFNIVAWNSLFRPHNASLFRGVVVGWLAGWCSPSATVPQVSPKVQASQLQHHISIVDVSTANAAVIAQGVRRESPLTNSKDGLDLMRKVVVGDADVWRQPPKTALRRAGGSHKQEPNLAAIRCMQPLTLSDGSSRPGDSFDESHEQRISLSVGPRPQDQVGCQAK